MSVTVSELQNKIRASLDILYALQHSPGGRKFVANLTFIKSFCSKQSGLGEKKLTDINMETSIRDCKVYLSDINRDFVCIKEMFSPKYHSKIIREVREFISREGVQSFKVSFDELRAELIKFVVSLGINEQSFNTEALRTSARGNAYLKEARDFVNNLLRFISQEEGRGDALSVGVIFSCVKNYIKAAENITGLVLEVETGHDVEQRRDLTSSLSGSGLIAQAEQTREVVPVPDMEQRRNLISSLRGSGAIVLEEQAPKVVLFQPRSREREEAQRAKILQEQKEIERQQRAFLEQEKSRLAEEYEIKMQDRVRDLYQRQQQAFAEQAKVLNERHRQEVLKLERSFSSVSETQQRIIDRLERTKAAHIRKHQEHIMERELLTREKQRIIDEQASIVAKYKKDRLLPQEGKIQKSDPRVIKALGPTREQMAQIEKSKQVYEQQNAMLTKEKQRLQAAHDKLAEQIVEQERVYGQETEELQKQLLAIQTEKKAIECWFIREQKEHKESVAALTVRLAEAEEDLARIKDTLAERDKEFDVVWQEKLSLREKIVEQERRHNTYLEGVIERHEAAMSQLLGENTSLQLECRFLQLKYKPSREVEDEMLRTGVGIMPATPERMRAIEQASRVPVEIEDTSISTVAVSISPSLGGTAPKSRF